MINRIFAGSGGKGALTYVLHDKEQDTSERAVVLHSTFCSLDVQGMSRELREMYSARRAIGKDIPKQPIRHFVLSCPPDEKLSDEQWNNAAQQFMSKLGYDGQPLIVVRHNDTDKDHIHIVTTRIKADGSLVSDSNERRHANTATQWIAEIMNLSKLPTKKKQKSNADPFSIQKQITVPRWAEMRTGKEYALAKLCKATGADLSALGPYLLFCIAKDGRTVAKLKGNTWIEFQAGAVKITAPNQQSRAAAASLLGQSICWRAAKVDPGCAAKSDPPVRIESLVQICG